MTYERFVAEVMERAGIRDSGLAAHAVASTLEVLGERLLEIDTRVVAERLPPQLAGSLRRHRQSAEFGLQEFYERVSGREGIVPGLALEHAQVVCQVLAEAVDDTARAHLRMRLPEDLAALFTPRRKGVLPRHIHTVPPEEGTTLATGRPTSHRPLSEAHGQPGSVVETDEPHEDRKLSSSAARHGRSIGGPRRPGLHDRR